jgi:signal transduction histidine kinase
MRFIKLLSAILALGSLLIVPVSAFERGTKKEAITLVQKALAHIETVGLEQALQDFKKPTDNPFRDRDLYVFVYNYQGDNLANSAQLNLPDTNLKNYRTPDGKLVVQEMIEMTKANGGGALHYHFFNPQTNEVEPKISYFKKIPDLDGFIGCGYYEVDEAEAKKAAMELLRKAMNHIETVGLEQALADLKRPDNSFHDHELYVFVYDYQGNNLANSTELNLPGINLKNYRTADGKLIIQQMIEMTKANGGGALEYDMLNPETNQMQSKISYFRKIPGFDGFIGSGYYRSKTQ